jgi:hypothetical protein
VVGGRRVSAWLKATWRGKVPPRWDADYGGAGKQGKMRRTVTGEDTPLNVALKVESPMRDGAFAGWALNCSASFCAGITAIQFQKLGDRQCPRSGELKIHF